MSFKSKADGFFTKVKRIFTVCYDFIKFICGKIANHIKKFYLLYLAVIFTALGVILRTSYLDYKSIDYNNFLTHWYTDISKMPGLKGFGAETGDYTPPYKYIITILTKITDNDLYALKTVSIIFDFIMAIFIGLIVRHLTKSNYKAFMGYAITLFFPSVFLNSAVWAQCDGIFTCFIIISFYFFLKDKYYLCAVFYAISFSFKIQAIFFAPVYAIAIYNKKLKIRHVLVGLLTYLLMGLPAIIAGCKPYNVYIGTYLKQTGEYTDIHLNVANIYSFLQDSYTDKGLSDMFLVAAVATVIMLMIFIGRKKQDKQSLPFYAFFFTLVIPYLLPHMHERYYYTADVFAIIFVIIYPKKMLWALSTVTVSLTGIIRMTMEEHEQMLKFFPLFGVVIGVVIILMIKAIFENKVSSYACCAPLDQDSLAENKVEITKNLEETKTETIEE